MSTIVLKKGDKNNNVKILQRALGINDDGIFGTQTEECVKEFQEKNGLVADGIVGELTQKALGISIEDNIDITFFPITKHITKKKRQIKYIVLHYTAGGSSKKGSAVQTRNLFQNSNRGASADFCVDDETIVQINSDPLNYYCWAVGDGKGKYGITNANSISIEMCSTLKKGTSAAVGNHQGWSISSNVIELAIKLVKYLMEKYNIPIENVVRHYDASRKSCPGIIGWNDNEIYNENGKRLSVKNNSNEWLKFKEKLK